MGNCRKWFRTRIARIAEELGERGEDAAGGGTHAKQQEWPPLEGEGGEPGQAGSLKQSVGGSWGGAKFLKAPLLLVPGR